MRLFAFFLAALTFPGASAIHSLSQHAELSAVAGLRLNDQQQQQQQHSRAFVDLSDHIQSLNQRQTMKTKAAYVAYATIANQRTQPQAGFTAVQDWPDLTGNNLLWVGGQYKMGDIASAFCLSDADAVAAFMNQDLGKKCNPGGGAKTFKAINNEYAADRNHFNPKLVPTHFGVGMIEITNGANNNRLVCAAGNYNPANGQAVSEGGTHTEKYCFVQFMALLLPGIDIDAIRKGGNGADKDTYAGVQAKMIAAAGRSVFNPAAAEGAVNVKISWCTQLTLCEVACAKVSARFIAALEAGGYTVTKRVGSPKNDAMCI